MATIAIKLNPQVMVNPDLDIRCSIPDKIQEETNGALTDDGYDYLEDSCNSIVIYLKSKSPNDDINDVLRILESNKFSDNQILETATLGVKKDKEYVVVHPKDCKENIVFD